MRHTKSIHGVTKNCDTGYVVRLIPRMSLDVSVGETCKENEFVKGKLHTRLFPKEIFVNAAGR